MTDSIKEKSLLWIEDVYKIYGDKVVLDDIDLAVAAGEFVTVVGPSGCGKSTLLRLILGQEFPTRGTILLEGKPIGFADPSRGIVYQRYSLFRNRTVLGNVLEGPRLSLSFRERRKRKNELVEEAKHFLEKVNLASDLAKYPHELSGGMRQRVAIAQSLIMKPKILLMDEPFGALDPSTRQSMQLFLLELWEDLGMTIFFVTHDLHEAVFLGTRIIVLSHQYLDDRGEYRHVKRGAKVIADHPLSATAKSVDVKKTAEFGELIEDIRMEVDARHTKHVKDFNLKHPFSWRTLRDEELSSHDTTQHES
ncbi:ABC transporter, ATP-binding protein (cluster 10, nitrate/sulfonate/bicarbonate) [Olavius algarvensis Delta 1 endosymbiont]|nr:ABC transporter, ATP-binding protein (cluster 10, nitrate/sulfonate/bicarbonate) [Olavius algarvensis Delta 1 endosymbiont]